MSRVADHSFIPEECRVNAYKLAFYSGMVRITANVLMLGAVALGMYRVSLQPEAALSVFSAWVFGLLVPVWGGAWFVNRWLRRRYPVLEEGPDVTRVSLPGKGETRVRWTVIERQRPRSELLG